MPAISEVSKNAKKIKEQIAEKAGVAPKEINDANLQEVGKALEGAAKVSATGADPTQVPVGQLKEVATGEKDTTPEKKNSNQQKIAMAIAAIAPTLIGYAFGGNEGGAIGAQQGQTMLKTIGDQDAAEAKDAREFAQKKELKTQELAAKAEEGKANREKDMMLAKERSEDRKAMLAGQQESRDLTNMMKREQLAKNQQEAEFKKSFEGRLAKLGAEGKQRLDNARMGLIAVQGMSDALNMGQNTFSVWGDNDFTQQRSLFEEALGRMQSGGAISKEEEARFKNMAPTFRDSPEMKAKKLANLQAEMTSRIHTLGFQPDELGVKTMVAQQPAKGGGGSILTNEANAAPAAPDFDNMSEEELKKYLGK